MAKKKTTKYAKFPSTGDLYFKGEKFELKNELTQKQLETLFNGGFTEIVYKIEG